MKNLLVLFCFAQPASGNAHSGCNYNRHAINNDSHICTEMHSINKQSIFPLSFVHFNLKEEKTNRISRIARREKNISNKILTHHYRTSNDNVNLMVNNLRFACGFSFHL